MIIENNSMGRTLHALDLIAERHKALSSNLANMDTPGYVRRDVDFAEYLGSMNSPLETKLSERLGASAVISQRTYEEIRPDKELMELQNNALLYTMATRRMSNIITEMKTVINVGK